jgi:ATP-binding cassette, subfamily C (CFTR/MRP), member 1
VSINILEFLAFAAFLLIMTIIMLRVYLPAATQVKRMRATTAGSLVGLVAETLEGLPLIQAYRHENAFQHVRCRSRHVDMCVSFICSPMPLAISALDVESDASARFSDCAAVQEFTRQTDTHHRTMYTADSLAIWLSIWCDLYGAIMLVAVCFFAVSQRSRGAPVVGLAFSNTIQLLIFYTYALRLVTEAITLSASVEGLAWLAQCTPIDGADDVNNAGKGLTSARPLACCSHSRCA